MKLRFATFALLALTMTTLTSCWKTDEDWSLCAVDDNLVLEFSIENVPDAEFGQYIETFDVYLLDEEMLPLETRRIASPDADGKYRTKYTLNPGTYYAISWGNAGSHSTVFPPRRTHNIENSYVEMADTQTGDPLYYAPHKTPELLPTTRAVSDYTLYEITVPANETTVHPMVFRKVHRTVEVFISRYETTDYYDGKAPIVERTGARSRFDFLLHYDRTPHTLNRRAADSGRTEATLSTSFSSALVPLQNDGWVRLIHPTTGQMLAEINIADYVRQHNITDDSYIPIQFIFDMDANVTVTMPSWNNNDITPEVGVD
jgi:hypothetical protein